MQHKVVVCIAASEGVQRARTALIFCFVIYLFIYFPHVLTSSNAPERTFPVCFSSSSCELRCSSDYPWYRDWSVDTSSELVERLPIFCVSVIFYFLLYFSSFVIS
uniref:Uncharacterized protein n=1 Tax=Physcomitrium patens TaxID=3218 RepID=A0A2K1JHI3_PHYPA|nr:hypothetical protein PHYPA_018382 [Physcomitrium patens]